MKKSRLFMTAGGIVLAISAVFATKASKKFLGATIQTVTAVGFPASNKLLYNSKIFTTNSLTGWVPVSLMIYTGTTYNSNVKAIGGQLEDGTSTDGDKVFVQHSTF